MRSGRNCRSRESLSQDSRGTEAGASDDPLNGSGGDRHCTGRTERVMSGPEAITSVVAQRHSGKRRQHAAPAEICAYVTSGGPLVTTRTGPGELAQGADEGAWIAKLCNPIGGRVRSTPRAQSAFVGEAHGGSASDAKLKAGRVGIAPRPDDAAAMQYSPQRSYRLNLRPAKARRLSKAGRHWAPITRQRATRKARQSGRTWPTYCRKPNRRRASTAWCALSPGATAL
jgi:hypothetical protein